MKRIFQLSILLLAAALLMAGTWTTNKFFYKPSIGASGQAQKDLFDTGMDRVDTRLGSVRYLGDQDYTTIAEALTTIGSTETTLVIPAEQGSVALAGHTTVPANVQLVVLKGAYFTLGSYNLTINGPVEAGPYQIFDDSGAGAVTMTGTSNIYDDWFDSPPSDPEGSVGAGIGSLFIRTTGTIPTIYVKATGTGNTGWVSYVHTSGAETIAGVKTFSSIPEGPASDPTTDNQLTRKSYVDNKRQCARMERTGGNQTIATDNTTQIQFNTDVYDSDGITNTSTYRITPTIAGYYYVELRVSFITGTVASNSAVNLYIYVNGVSTFASRTYVDSTSDSQTLSARVGDVAYVDGDDYIEAYIRQDTGVNMAVFANGTETSLTVAGSF